MHLAGFTQWLHVPGVNHIKDVLSLPIYCHRRRAIAERHSVSGRNHLLRELVSDWYDVGQGEAQYALKKIRPGVDGGVIRMGRLFQTHLLSLDQCQSDELVVSWQRANLICRLHDHRKAMAFTFLYCYIFMFVSGSIVPVCAPQFLMLASMVLKMSVTTILGSSTISTCKKTLL